MVLNDESSSGDEGGWFGGPSVFRYLIVATAFTSVFWIPHFDRCGVQWLSDAEPRHFR